MRRKTDRCGMEAWTTFNKKDFRDTEHYGIEIVKPGEFFDILGERR